MPSSQTKATTVAEYVAIAPKEARPKLKQLRAAIRSAAPKATEALKWGSPTVSYDRILVAYAAFKDHINFMPTPRVLRAFAKDLKKYKTGKGTVHFPLDAPLPLPLIKKMTKLRAKLSVEEDAKWM
jgi:uncharacterized protein YdhG (YjbR/CyaY superfamily)